MLITYFDDSTVHIVQFFIQNNMNRHKILFIYK